MGLLQRKRWGTSEYAGEVWKAMFELLRVSGPGGC